MGRPPHRSSRLPAILFWIAFLLVLILLGPIGYAIVSLDSRPGGSGADWPAKLLVGLIVLGIAAIAGLIARLAPLLALRLLGRRREGPGPKRGMNET